MSRRASAAVLAALLLGAAGCQAPPVDSAAATRPLLNKRRSVEITPADEAFVEQRKASDRAPRPPRASRQATELTEDDLYALPKFTVTRKGFAKFGLSVVTNTEVALGGTIEWMHVGVVLPGSPAGRQGLFTGIEILAIDNVPIGRLSREDMLHLLFERESGERVRLLVYSRLFGPLPRFVTL